MLEITNICSMRSLEERKFNNMEKVIYSKRIAIKLRELGFQIKRTEVNRSKPQYDCYIFELTEELQKALDEKIFK